MSPAEYSYKFLKAIFCIPANTVDPDQTAPKRSLQENKQLPAIVLKAVNSYILRVYKILLVLAQFKIQTRQNNINAL